MSTSNAEASRPASPLRMVGFAREIPPAIVGLLAIVGVVLIWSSGLILWSMWTTDALKSIGMVIPVVSFLLILRVWRTQHWQLDGSWWGFALLFATAVVVKLREQSILVLVLSPEWNLYIPPPSLVVLAYGVGFVLLFGGWRLLRASVFPLVLLLFVNPVPHLFNVYVDLPLQRASAHVARGFAMALGQPLSPDKLRLMFTPEFGMFIAPGCNGIRGALTMGLIALVAGHLYRFRWRAHAVVVLCAILLGYVFNFVRLCVLVLYYLVALKITWLQDKAENGDYIIGAVLFFVAVYLLYVAIQRLGANHSAVSDTPATDETSDPQPVAGSSFYWRAAAVSVLIAVALLGVVVEMTASRPSAELQADESALGQFPAKTGSYTLIRRWNENLLTGALLFHWAEYAPDNGGTHIAIGVSPVLGSHDTLVCHSARGEDPIWHGQQQFATGDGETSFSSAFYNDGSTQYLESTTLCNGASCSEYSTPQGHFGLVYSQPHPETLLHQNADRPIPILIKAEAIDTTIPADVARRQLSSDVTTFLAGLSLNALTRPYRR